MESRYSRLFFIGVTLFSLGMLADRGVSFAEQESESSISELSKSKDVNNSENNIEKTYATAESPSDNEDVLQSGNQRLSENKVIGQGFYDDFKSSGIASILGIGPQSALPYRSSQQQNFIDEIRQGAIDGWKNHSILPSISIAQAIVESAWGKSQLATQGHNLFGIKGSYQGQSISFPTQEWVNGHYITIQADFRKYPNWSTSVEDHGNFFHENSRYSNLIGVTNYTTVAQLLQQDGYATSPTYAKTLISIIDTYNLNDIDKSLINGFYSLDIIKNNGRLVLSGWHINETPDINKRQQIIFIDADTGSELYSTQPKRVQRPDVHSAFPTVSNSMNSGFLVDISVPNILKGKNIKIVSKYYDDQNGWKGAYFSNVFTIDPQMNNGSLDVAKLSGDNLQFSGWSINNYSEETPYSFLILRDKNTERELCRIPFTRKTRRDVYNAYPTINNSINSGFDVSIPLNGDLFNKNIEAVVRYSNSIDGEGTENVDTYFSEKVLNTELSMLDRAYVEKGQLKISGWQVNDSPTIKRYSNIIILDANTGKEIKRVAGKRGNREDVGELFSNIPESSFSGYTAELNIDSSLQGRSVKLISRYSQSADGEFNYSDSKYSQVIEIPDKINLGTLDSLSIKNNVVYPVGWHVIDCSNLYPYSFWIVMDANTGREISRVKMNRALRPDVEKAIPYVFDSLHSGYSNLKITDKLKGKKVFLISRYSSQSNGEGNIKDFRFNYQPFIIK